MALRRSSWRVLARTGNIGRFPTDNHFAAYAGVAPREVSSGDVIRHRLSRGGDRQLNYALHVIAITQIAMPKGKGRAFYDWKRADGRPGRKPSGRSNDAWPPSSTDN
jgi:transposase